MRSPGHDVTAWLQELHAGNPTALDRLVPLLYDELREMAHGRMARERVDHTLSTTCLVSEVYLRFREQDRIGAGDRTGFLAAAGNTMRRILVDHARAKRSRKRGGGAALVPFEAVESFLADEAEAEELIELDEALSRMERINPDGAVVVEHRFFGGLTLEESATVLGVSTKTVRRRWLAARAWLRRELGASATVVAG